MRKIEELLTEYGESHQNPVNKKVHWICVPLIFFSIVGLLWSIPSSVLIDVFGNGNNPYMNWATVVLVIVLVYYTTLSIPLMIGMMMFAVSCLYLARALTLLDIAPLWLISLIIFVVAWVGQFYGHKIEGKKPSFLKDVQFLLIGPAWLMHFIYKKLGIPY